MTSDQIRRQQSHYQELLSINSVDKLFDALRGSAYLFKKMTPGYNQIQIKEEDISKTAFCAKFGFCRCIVLDFRMTNAPSTFITYMNKVFTKHIGIQALIYLDNIIFYSLTKKQLQNDLTLVLKTLKKTNS